MQATLAKIFLSCTSAMCPGVKKPALRRVCLLLWGYLLRLSRSQRSTVDLTSITRSSICFSHSLIISILAWSVLRMGWSSCIRLTFPDKAGWRTTLLVARWLFLDTAGTPIRHGCSLMHPRCSGDMIACDFVNHQKFVSQQ